MGLMSSVALANNTQILMQTNKGNIEIELFDEKAPITVKNFKDYVQSHFYDGTIFHRVIADFMIQGGGMTPDMEEKITAPSIRNESSNQLKNERGTLAMARTSNPNSATSQFFINLKNNDFLNRSAVNSGYAVFGQVTKGMEIVDEIAQVPTGQYRMHGDVPLDPVIINSVTIKNNSK